MLSVEDRAEVDRRLAGRMVGLSDKQVRAAALAAAYELDPRSVVDRAAYAVTQRRVTMRPAPGTMAYLTALLPGDRRRHPGRDRTGHVRRDPDLG